MAKHRSTSSPTRLSSSRGPTLPRDQPRDSGRSAALATVAPWTSGRAPSSTGPTDGPVRCSPGTARPTHGARRRPLHPGAADDGRRASHPVTARRVARRIRIPLRVARSTQRRPPSVPQTAEAGRSCVGGGTSPTWSNLSALCDLPSAPCCRVLRDDTRTRQFSRQGNRICLPSSAQAPARGA